MHSFFHIISCSLYRFLTCLDKLYTGCLLESFVFFCMEIFQIFSLGKTDRIEPQKQETGNRKREDAAALKPRPGICRLSSRHSLVLKRLQREGGNRATRPTRPPPPGDVRPGVWGSRDGQTAGTAAAARSVSGPAFIPFCPVRALRRFLLSRQSRTYKSEEVSRPSSDDDKDEDDDDDDSM